VLIRKSRTSKGFSLAEVLVAMFVIVVGIAGVTSSIWWAMSKADSGKFMTEATNHARALYETIVGEGLISAAAEASSTGWPDGSTGLVDTDPDARTALLAPPFHAVGLAVQAQALGQSSDTNEISSDTERFTRNISIVRGDPTSRTATEFYLDDLAFIQVRIYWNEKGHERKAEVRGVARHNLGS
jgi:prepilin-type N-terminal cleavage/methylation domain-containing protein